MKLVEITENNFYEVIQLKVAEAQSTWVRDPLYTLAEGYMYRNDDTVLLFALEKAENIVGFLALLTEAENKTISIWRMLIGDTFQGQGFGREALQTIERYALQEKQFDKIKADYVIGNDAIKYLLESEGYLEIGEQEEWNEIIMAKNIGK